MADADTSARAVVEAANELIDVMDAHAMRGSPSQDGGAVLAAVEDGLRQESSSSPAARPDTDNTPFGGATVEKVLAKGATPQASFDSVRKEMETQEKIIVALQRDNEALLKEKKDIASRCKQLEHDFEHLEAKHSLLLSAQQDFATRSSLHATNDSAKIVNLQAQVEDLQTTLETEKRRCALLLQERGDVTRSKSDTPVRTHAGESGPLAEQMRYESKGKDAAAKVRESQRAHDVQKNAIDGLHAEVARLESEKQTAHTRERSLLHEVDSLRGQVRELESALRQKKESIGELIRSCQESSGNVQRLKKQESRIRLLEAALLEKDDFTRHAMEKLRAETKEVCDRYQGTITELQQRLEIPRDDPEQRRRISVLEKENLELRRAIGGGAVSRTAEKAAAVTIADTGAEGSEKAPGGANAAEVIGEPAVKEAAAGQAESSRLHAVIHDLRAELDDQKQQCARLQSRLTGVQAEWDARLAEMKGNFAHQLQALRSSHNGDLSRLEANHQSQLLEVSKAAQANGGDSFVARLSRIVDEKGYDASLVAIGERLRYLEKRCCQKEEEAAYELQETKRIAELEKKLEREKTDVLLERKNTQIKRFQTQLDELLAALSILQSTS
ncbi:hypothetical protein NESM_000768000 [Novymonas esmeraldas]|uniref:Centrosomal protein of 162 kDa n=1 Tax=Novymonas esmeraldas TaxID=1808958 RepID=A0AAW0EYB5_9TRYP